MDEISYASESTNITAKSNKYIYTTQTPACFEKTTERTLKEENHIKMEKKELQRAPRRRGESDSEDSSEEESKKEETHFTKKFMSKLSLAPISDTVKLVANYRL